jgi:hypothetical protein
MTGTPAQYKHFDGSIATYTMTPVVSFFEPDIRLNVFGLDMNVGKPGV